MRQATKYARDVLFSASIMVVAVWAEAAGHGDATAVLASDPGDVAALVGKPAPELHHIREWKNSEPLRLADLRGRYVILDFWGFWCGPCMRDIPNLMAIAEAFPKDALVIIGVHDASAASFKEVDAKLERVRQQIWMGHDINYPEALDGNGTPANEAKTGSGATTQAYGITSFPTAVLIDPKGIVLGRFHAPSLDKKIEGLAKLLDTAARTPPWYDRFRVIYGLKPGEALRHVPEPYPAEREEFYFRQFSRWGWWQVGFPPDIPKSATLTWYDDPGRVDGGMDFGGKRLLDLLRDFGFDEREFEGESALLEREIPGDWVMRHGTEREKLLGAFATILNKELGLPIRFKPCNVERDVYVATGEFKLRPLGGAYGESQIQLFASQPDPADTIKGGGGSGDLDALLDYVGGLASVRIVNECSSRPNVQLSWRQHSSAKSNTMRNSSAQFEQLLESLSKQTGLQFKKERRQTAVFRVIEGQ